VAPGEIEPSSDAMLKNSPGRNHTGAAG